VLKRTKPSLFDIRRKPNQLDAETDIRKSTYAAGIGMTIPFVLLTGPLMGWFVGSWLDGRYGTGWITIFAVLLGLAGSIQLTVKMIKEIST
jgi:hypothetical protein